MATIGLRALEIPGETTWRDLCFGVASMHGIVMAELQSFVVARAGAVAWERITYGAGLSDRLYFPLGSYPDDEALTLVAASCRHLHLDTEAFLRAFGRHLVPPLLSTYGHSLRSDWKSLEVLEHSEQTIHARVRHTTPSAQPPMLVTTRTTADEVVIQYRSARRLCYMALGVVDGLGEAYGETLDVSQRRCMLNGDPECEIVVQRRRTAGQRVP